MNTTVIHSCDCKHEYQDSKYGKGQRVFNVGGGKDKKKIRCTVCGRELQP